MKYITHLLIACAAILLTSCGDSSSESSSPANANSPISVFTVEELNQYSCNKSQENTVVYIEEDDSYHTCLNENDSWKWVSQCKRAGACRQKVRAGRNSKRDRGR